MGQGSSKRELATVSGDVTGRCASSTVAGKPYAQSVDGTASPNASQLPGGKAFHFSRAKHSVCYSQPCDYLHSCSICEDSAHEARYCTQAGQAQSSRGG